MDVFGFVVNDFILGFIFGVLFTGYLFLRIFNKQFKPHSQIKKLSDKVTRRDVKAKCSCGGRMLSIGNDSYQCEDCNKMVKAVVKNKD